MILVLCAAAINRSQSFFSRNKNCRTSASDVESDEENEEGVYTVFECPGLAANLGEIEITNPNFQHENVDTPTNEAKK